MAAESRRDLTDLPDSISFLILERLPLSSYVRIAAVCVRWRELQHRYRSEHFPSPPPMLSLPWFVPHGGRDYRRACINARSPLEDSVDEETKEMKRVSYRLQNPYILPEHLVIKSKYYVDPKASRLLAYAGPVGACSGWLVLTDVYFRVFLVNPISGGFITLPGLTDFPYGRRPLAYLTPPPHYAVFMLALTGKVHVIRKGGDACWVQLSVPNLPICRFISIAGDLYCVCRNWDIALVRSRTLDVVGFVMDDKSDLPPPDEVAQLSLADSEGRLLLVLRMKKANAAGEGGGFRVFEADVCGRKWVRKESIGDRVLIITYSRTLLLPASSGLARHDGAFKGNTILFYGPLPGPASWRLLDFATGELKDRPSLDARSGYRHMFLPSLIDS